MRALCWHGKNDVRVDTVPDPEIREPTDAIIKITSTAICGSDLHLFAPTDGLQPSISHIAATRNRRARTACLQRAAANSRPYRKNGPAQDHFDYCGVLSGRIRGAFGDREKPRTRNGGDKLSSYYVQANPPAECYRHAIRMPHIPGLPDRLQRASKLSCIRSRANHLPSS
jgi:hypothetical protein